MQYTKPSLTPEQQADLLLSRGLIAERPLLVQRLSAVSYYRLSGYCFPFRKPDDTFWPGTTFEKIWDRYVFDRKLRLLVMDAIERIEVAVRTQLALRHSQLHGAFGYCQVKNSLPKFTPEKWSEFLRRLAEEKSRSKETFVLHFDQKYGDSHAYLPIWMVAEIMAMGSTLSFFRNCPNKVKADVSRSFGIPETVFESWLLSLNAVRNICAHHGRLWNRELGVKPKIPYQHDYPEWHDPVVIPNHRVFAALTLCQHCLKNIAPQSKWKQRFRDLLAAHPNIPQRDMGIPIGWESSRVWN
jgi:abortive infection bacteriophage resistance protein